MRYDLKQINTPGKYEAGEGNTIVKLGVCLMDDADIYGEWVKLSDDTYTIQKPDMPSFKINDTNIKLNKDGCYEISDEFEEELNITSFTIPTGFPTFTAEYIIGIKDVQTGQD